MMLSHRTEGRNARIRSSYVPVPKEPAQIAVSVNQDEYARRLRDLNVSGAAKRKLKRPGQSRGVLHKKLRAVMSDGRWRTFQDVYTAMGTDSVDGKRFIREALETMRKDNIFLKDIGHHRVPMWRLV